MQSTIFNNRQFFSSNGQNHTAMLKEKLEASRQQPTTIPRDHYPTLTAQQKEKFFHYTAALNSGLTPWDALLFTIYRLSEICTHHLRNEVATNETAKWFAETTIKLYTHNYLSAFYENNPNFQEERMKIASDTAQMIFYLTNQFQVHSTRLKSSQITPIKKKGIELQNAGTLLTIATLFANHSSKDTLLEGRLSDLQTPCNTENLTHLLQFCEFSQRTILFTESLRAQKELQREPTTILLQSAFLKKYCKEGSLLPLDENQKEELLNILIAVDREKKRDSEILADEIAHFSPEIFHLSKRCLEWFGSAMNSHHGGYFSVQYQGAFICTSVIIEEWKQKRKNSFMVPQEFINPYLSTLPGRKLISACRTFSRDMEEFIFNHSVDKFNLFVKDITNLLSWDDAVKELQPLITLGEELFDALPNLSQQASTEFLLWTKEQNPSKEDQTIWARGYSSLIYNEILPILPFILALKKLPTYFKITDPVQDSEPQNLILEMTFFQYLMHVLDQDTVEALNLLDEEFLIEQLSTLVVEEKGEALSVEEKVEQTNRAVKSKPLSKKTKNAEKKKKRDEKLQEIQKKANEKSLDTTKQTPLVPLSIKREKLIKVVLEKFGGTYRIHGGHLIFTTEQNRTVVIPAHGKTIAPGTLQAILKQLGEKADDK